MPKVTKSTLYRLANSLPADERERAVAEIDRTTDSKELEELHRRLFQGKKGWQTK